MFSAAEICQQEIEHALAGIPNTRNIIIGGCYTDELRLQTEEVFKQLREKNLITQESVNSSCQNISTGCLEKMSHHIW